MRHRRRFAAAMFCVAILSSASQRAEARPASRRPLGLWAGGLATARPTMLLPVTMGSLPKTRLSRRLSSDRASSWTAPATSLRSLTRRR